LTPQQILRSFGSDAHQNWDYRELRERIADGCTLPPVHRLLLSAGAATTMRSTRLHPADARNAQGDQ